MKKSGATPSTREGILKHQHERFIAMGGKVDKKDIMPTDWRNTDSAELLRQWQVGADFGNVDLVKPK